MDLNVYDHVSYMGYDYVYNIGKCLVIWDINEKYIQFFSFLK